MNPLIEKQGAAYPRKTDHLGYACGTEPRLALIPVVSTGARGDAQFGVALAFCLSKDVGSLVKVSLRKCYFPIRTGYIAANLGTRLDGYVMRLLALDAVKS